MPEFEELLALRICSPRGDGVAQISASLAELGYLHYGPRALFQPQQPPQPTPTEAIVTTQASAAEDESNEDFARRRQLATESDLLQVAQTVVKRQDDATASVTEALDDPRRD